MDSYSQFRVGGAQGIGAATVQLLWDLGAHVFFGDWDERQGQELEHGLAARQSPSGGSAHFVRLDVREYDSQLALFDLAFQAHNRVDVAISCAAVAEPGGLFEPENLNLETVRIVC